MKAASSQTPSEHDFELLSAYIDGELTDSERDALEKRLSDDVQLRAALISLRNTARLIHDLPHLKAPRSFTLDPAVYGRKPSVWRRLVTPGIMLQVSGALGAAASVVLIALALLYGKPEQTEVKERGQQAAVSITESAQQTEAVALAPTGTPALLPTMTLAIVTANAAEEYAAESEGALPSTNVVPPGAVGGEQGFYAPTQQIDIAQAAPNNQFSANDEMSPSGAAEAAAAAPAQPAPTATMKMMLTASPMPTASDGPLEIQQQEQPSTGTQNEPEVPLAEEAQDSAAFKATEMGTPAQVAQETAMRDGATATTESVEKDHSEPAEMEMHPDEKDYRWLAGVGAAALIGSLGLVLMGRRRSRV